MAITATYIDSTSLTIVGNHTNIFMADRAIECNCGVDGLKKGEISSSSYSSPDTTINLRDISDGLTSNLTAIKYNNQSLYLPRHNHDDTLGSGGKIGSWSGWFDDGTNFRVTVVNGIITGVAASSVGGYGS